MLTPAGTECSFYYADFHRGHNTQLCRLLENNHLSLPWQPKDCEKCPVPDIASANASPNLHLELMIEPVFLGLGRRITVQASCYKHDIPVEDPHIGCPQCAAERPGLDLFMQALEESDD